MAEPYTAADVELVADMVGGILGIDEFAGTDYVARRVLTALAEAGRLAPVDDDPRHIIEFRPDGWTIKHPLACRPNLFACRVNRAAERDLSRFYGPPYLGLFEVSANDRGDRIHIGEQVAADG